MANYKSSNRSPFEGVIRSIIREEMLGLLSGYGKNTSQNGGQSYNNVPTGPAQRRRRRATGRKAIAKGRVTNRSTDKRLKANRAV